MAPDKDTKDTKVHKSGGVVSSRSSQVARAAVTAFVTFVTFVSLSGSAYAELAFFANGRSISIKGHVADGDSLVLNLRNGGQMIVEPGMIARFEPDEVPYPEPEVTAATSVAPPSAGAAVPYGELIDKVSKEQGVDARLVRAMIQVESAYKQTARSRKGAMGLMQLMPETARQYAVRRPVRSRVEYRGGHQAPQELADASAGGIWPWPRTTPAKRPSRSFAAFLRTPKRAVTCRGSSQSRHTDVPGKPAQLFPAVHGLRIKGDRAIS